MYSIIKTILFLFDAEKVHYFTFSTIRLFCKFPGIKSFLRWIFVVDNPQLKRTVFGIDFPNPVGLAAGFDKDAKLFDELACFGFGFIEIGTVTPLPQAGNEKPRLFRLKSDRAIINRMGFNNRGADVAASHLRFKKTPNLIIGGNIGKNKLTANEDAVSDYIKCYHALKDHVDYFVVNVSSPNTPGLRELQEKEPLKALLSQLKNINDLEKFPKPILLKIAPDLTDSQLDDIVEIIFDSKIDGIIATNTTISRDGLKTPEIEVKNAGAGGLSGAPLTNRSTDVIRYLSQKSNGNIPIIGAGGIMSAKDAQDKLNAGAVLVQIYTGFIYEGPSLVKQINRSLLQK